MQYLVKLWGIRWDDGKGEYAHHDLPRNLSVAIEASSVDEAIERALNEATDMYAMLIDDVKQAEVELI